MPPAHEFITPDFEKYARRLNDVKFSTTARYTHELMSGALMWADEKPDIPFSELGWFRAALAYRSSVILGDPLPEYEPIWKELQRLAPKWPGFQPERCAPSPEIVGYLKKKKKGFERYLDRCNKMASGCWKPLSGENRAL